MLKYLKIKLIIYSKNYTKNILIYQYYNYLKFILQISQHLNFIWNTIKEIIINHKNRYSHCLIFNNILRILKWMHIKKFKIQFSHIKIKFFNLNCKIQIILSKCNKLHKIYMLNKLNKRKNLQLNNKKSNNQAKNIQII